MKKISEIREELKNTPDNELAGFIEQFSDDERDGVKKILDAAQKRMDKLDAERRRIYEISAYEREFVSRGLVCGIDA